MPEIFAAALNDAGFAAALVCDGILQLSLIFSLVYAVGLLAASFIPARTRLAPNALCIPALLLLSVLLLVSPWGRQTAFSLYVCLAAVLETWGAGEWFGPSVTGVWLAVALWLCGRLLIRLRILRGRVRRLPPAPEDPVFAAALRTVRPRCRVALKIGPSGSGAASSSSGGGVVVIPAGFMDTHEAGERYLIYLHELTHIRRGDSRKHRIAGLLRALAWFNPVAGRALERYLGHLEIACDRQVLGLPGVAPYDYAALMLKRPARGLAMGQGFSSSPGELARRLRYIFRDAAFFPPGRERAACLVCAVFFGALFLFGSLRMPDPAFALPPDEAYAFTGPDGESRVVAPGDPVTVTAPDGTAVTLRVRFQCQGILGQYAVTSFEPRERGEL